MCCLASVGMRSASSTPRSVSPHHRLRHFQNLRHPLVIWHISHVCMQSHQLPILLHVPRLRLLTIPIHPRTPHHPSSAHLGSRKQGLIIHSFFHFLARTGAVQRDVLRRLLHFHICPPMRASQARATPPLISLVFPCHLQRQGSAAEMTRLLCRFSYPGRGPAILRCSAGRICGTMSLPCFAGLG